MRRPVLTAVTIGAIFASMGVGLTLGNLRNHAPISRPVAALTSEVDDLVITDQIMFCELLGVDEASTDEDDITGVNPIVRTSIGSMQLKDKWSGGQLDKGKYYEATYRVHYTYYVWGKDSSGKDRILLGEIKTLLKAFPASTDIDPHASSPAIPQRANVC